MPKVIANENAEIRVDRTVRTFFRNIANCLYITIHNKVEIFFIKVGITSQGRL